MLRPRGPTKKQLADNVVTALADIPASIRTIESKITEENKKIAELAKEKERMAEERDAIFLITSFTMLQKQLIAIQKDLSDRANLHRTPNPDPILSRQERLRYNSVPRRYFRAMQQLKYLSEEKRKPSNFKPPKVKKAESKPCDPESKSQSASTYLALAAIYKHLLRTISPETPDQIVNLLCTTKSAINPAKQPLKVQEFLRNFLKAIHSNFAYPPTIYIGMLILAERYLKLTAEKLHVGNINNLLLFCFLLAADILDDHPFSVKKQIVAFFGFDKHEFSALQCFVLNRLCIFNEDGLIESYFLSPEQIEFKRTQLGIKDFSLIPIREHDDALKGDFLASGETHDAMPLAEVEVEVKAAATHLSSSASIKKALPPAAAAAAASPTRKQHYPESTPTPLNSPETAPRAVIVPLPFFPPEEMGPDTHAAPTAASSHSVAPAGGLTL